jgi:hypothetical protein
MNSSAARIYHVRDNVLPSRPVLHYDALNEKLVFALVICGHLLRSSHNNCMNFTEQQKQDMRTMPEESRTAKPPNQTADEPKIPQDPLGCTMPEAGRTAYLFGFVVFTCGLDRTQKTNPLIRARLHLLPNKSQSFLISHLEGHTLIGLVKELHTASVLLPELHCPWHHRNRIDPISLIRRDHASRIAKN